MKNTGIKISDLPPAYHRMVHEQLRGPIESAKLAPNVAQMAPNRSPIRQNHSAVLNRLESDFMERLRRFRENIKIQSITFKLANGCRYTPDFMTFENPSENNWSGIRAYEVKGPFFREDAKIKLKVAATEYPHIRFILAERIEGRWRETEVLP